MDIFSQNNEFLFGILQMYNAVFQNILCIIWKNKINMKLYHIFKILSISNNKEFLISDILKFKSVFLSSYINVRLLLRPYGSCLIS